jgi:hypothetical protein
MGGVDTEKHILFTSAFDRNRTFKNITKNVHLKQHIEDIEITDNRVGYREGNIFVTWCKEDVQSYEGDFSLDELEGLIFNIFRRKNNKNR